MSGYLTSLKRIFQKNKHRLSLPPLVSKELSNLIKRRNTKNKVVQRKSSKSNQTKLTLLQNLVTEQLNDDPRAYEESVFKNGIFCEIEKNVKSNQKSTQLPSEMYREGKKTITDLQKTELLKKFFQSVFTQERYRKRFDPYAVMKIDQLHFTKTEVKPALKNLPLGKAKGPDGLRNLSLKQTARSLPVSLKHVFNTITDKHKFPAEWKTSNNISLYKSGGKHCISIYCLILLLACVSKVLQPLILKNAFD